MTGSVSSSRLLLTLGAAGAMAGLLLMQVHSLTEPVIQRHREERLQAAVLEVLGGAERYETRWVVGDALTAEPPAGEQGGGQGGGIERVYVGYDADERRVGVAISGGSQGYQDRIELLFGYDPATGEVLGMKVLESKETPGLGDKIEKDEEWIAQFEGVVPPLTGVKAGRGEGGPSEVDVITGATISSRTIVRAINEALERIGPALEGER